MAPRLLPYADVIRGLQYRDVSVVGFPADMPDDGEHALLLRVRRERDFYLRLLNLGGCNDIEPLLKEGLDLVVELTGARQGYLELTGEGAGKDCHWWVGRGYSPEELDVIRGTISRGIVAQALLAGQTIVTPSAMLDPRFSDFESVRLGHIQAVLCAPIGDPPVGALYLERPGSFSAEDRENADLFARHLTTLADRLLTRRRQQAADDATRKVRETLHLDGVIGRSSALAAALRQAALAVPLDVNVMLLGETGTGKSQLARVIHHNGPRRNGPLVELNCAALPETLVESELFGAVPGGHSTATRRIEGKVAAAEGGTLVLDEIGDLPLAVQAKLLHLIDTREYFPLGSSRPCQADVRIVAATNADLKTAVADHKFRVDLFHRLHVLQVRMPSLAERRDDVPELAEHFCRKACERHRLPQLRLSPDAVRTLSGTAWLGNVRELANTVEVAAIRAASEHAEQVERAHLFADPTSGLGGAGGGPERLLTFQEATRRFQADLLRKTLEDNGWNVVDAAKTLDVARSHVYNLIRALGIERPR